MAWVMGWVEVGKEWVAAGSAQAREWAWPRQWAIRLRERSLQD
jgi:hypothetical protein